MAEVAAVPAGVEGGRPQRGGFGRGGRGGRGGREGKPRRDKEDGDGAWVPVTKLGRLVQAGKIKQLEEIYYHALCVKEYQIIDHFLGSKLVDEVMKIMPVQKQTTAGQRTRFKVFIAVGDNDGHIGLGVKCSSEVATAIRGAMILAKISIIPVRRGYWGAMIGQVHTVPYKVSGGCGSVAVRLIPAPRGTGLVASPVTKRFLTMAGIQDCYTSTTGKTRTTGNTLKACYMALRSTYSFLSPDLWPKTVSAPSPISEHASFLAKGKSVSAAPRERRPRGDRGDRPPRGDRRPRE